MNDALAITFPGQGSQTVGMLSGLAESFTDIRQTFEEGSDALGVDLWALSQNGPKEELNKTENTQPALLAAGIAVWRVWQGQGGATPARMAGHSLGEYTALTAAGALSFTDAVKLVAARGRFMQEAVPVGVGAMAAILGLDDETVRDVCAQAAQDQVASAVNYNSPGQVVIAGNADAIARAVELAKQAGAKRALPLDVSVPSHCDLMKGAAERLAEALEAINLEALQIPVIHNVSVETADNSAAIRTLLAQQLYNPVRWVETVQSMKAANTEALLELGPGKVLTGLAKRIDKSLTAMPVLDPASLEKALEATNV